MTVSDSTTDNYSYDAIDQVTSVGYGTGRNVGYSYDAVGNRTSLVDSAATTATTSYTTNSLNQYTTVAALVPSYDGNGNLTSINGWTYSYDAQNRLLSAGNGTTTEMFAYDPQNRCVSRTLTLNNQPSTTYYLYDGWQLAEELSGSGTEQALYVSGARTDELLYKATPTNTIFYQHDALGNTTALSDNSGNLVEHYTYDVFGRPSIYDASGNPLTVSAYNNRFLFTGREWLQEVGLYDYRNRVYSAGLGRFLQTDPMRFSAGDVNIYGYTTNDPMNAIDPYGFWSWHVIIYYIPFVGNAVAAEEDASNKNWKMFAVDVIAGAMDATGVGGPEGEAMMAARQLAIKEAEAQLKNKTEKECIKIESEDAFKKETPKTHPKLFGPVRGSGAKINKETGEIFQKDKFHKDHYETYKNKKDFENGDRSGAVWDDGREKNLNK